MPRWLSVTLAVYEPAASFVPAGTLTDLPGRIRTAAIARFFVPRAPLTLTVPLTGSSVLPVFLTGMTAVPLTAFALPAVRPYFGAEGRIRTAPTSR